jgi:hypothetical protein
MARISLRSPLRGDHQHRHSALPAPNDELTRLPGGSVETRRPDIGRCGGAKRSKKRHGQEGQPPRPHGRSTAALPPEVPLNQARPKRTLRSAGHALACRPVLYTGRLTARLPEAVRLLMFKADGSFLVHDDAGGFCPLNRIRSAFRPDFPAYLRLDVKVSGSSLTRYLRGCKGRVLVSCATSGYGGAETLVILRPTASKGRETE